MRDGMSQTVEVSVSRYDPDKDDKPRYQKYEVPFTRGMVVLDALHHIYENEDSSLAYRWNCRTGQCGSCSVMVNGKPRPACRTPIEPGQSYHLEPLPRFPVIRDLVVDIDRGVSRLQKIRPYVNRVKPAPRPETIHRQEADKVAELRKCIECWSCVAACPAIVDAWQEFIGPLGVRKLASLELDPRDVEDRARIAFMSGIYDCTTCGACKESCIKDIDVRKDAIEVLRALAVDRGYGPLPGHASIIHSVETTGYAVETQSTPFTETVPDVVKVDDPVDEVVLFPGCLMNLRIQNVALNVVEVLKRNRVEVKIPKEFQCCGSVLFRTGARGAAGKLVTQNIDYFEKLGTKKLVGLCPGCMTTIKQDWPLVLHEIGHAPYRFKAMDINEYLVHDLGIENMNTEDLHPLDTKVTYHDPCHLNRGQGISNEPRILLKLIPGLGLVETKESDRCCGSGGGVRAGRRPLSYEIGDRKIKSMADTGADAFVTSCSFCAIQLMDGAARHGLKEKIFNVTDLLAMSYRGERVAG
ncbi:MAG: fumarate reductase (CoM/CoB) subunit TfrB [Nitrososphaeria archaeon]